MKPGDLTKWQAAFNDLRVRGDSGLLGIEDALADWTVETNREIRRQSQIWMAAWRVEQAGITGWPATFDGRQN